MAAITESEIVRVAALMKIDARDAAAHVPKVQSMIGYFERLDSADLKGDALSDPAMDIGALREDEATACPDGLMDAINGEGGEHIRSPSLK